MVVTAEKNEFVIRPATTRDARGILECLAAAFEPYRASYTPAAYLDTILTAGTVLQRLQAMRVFVAVTAREEIVGTIACSAVDASEGHLRGMAALPRLHGCGIAERLLRAAEADLAQQGCSRITLDTTEPLRRAISFYEKHGYRASGRTTDFFGMPLHEYVKELQ